MTKDFVEMIVHVPLCSHPKVKKVLLFDIDNLDEELLKHGKIEVQKANLKEYSPQHCEFEVIIVGDINTIDDIGVAKINASLREDGVLVCGNLSWNSEPLKTIEQMKRLDTFHIVMPYMYGFGLEYNKQGAFLFCSKKHHPTADIILQKADLLDDLTYYNSDIHLSSFSLATSTKKAIREALKI